MHLELRLSLNQPILRVKNRVLQAFLWPAEPTERVCISVCLAFHRLGTIMD
jgi:hypothetical protein